MKDLFERLGDSLKGTYKEAVDQTQKTIDQTKYRKDILTLKNDLKKLYMQLGKECYSHQIKGESNYVNQPLCNRITAVKKELVLIEKQLEETMGHQKDSFESYKRDVRKTWDDKQEQGGNTYAQDGVEVMKFCSKCNVGNSPEAIYCSNCGTPF